jgi:AcrR family transcriptional regulator/DNA-binding MarR family transcriptional regulator
MLMASLNARARARTDARPSPRARGAGQVSHIQRQRILAAMADVTAERGAGQVTVAHIVARSGVSRRTFYELFSDREECLLAALDQAIVRATAAVLPAHRVELRWPARIRSALTALLAFLDEEPAMARLCVVESLAAGPRALQRRTRIVAALIDAVDEGREVVRPGKQPPPLTAEGIVGAVLAIVHTRLLRDGGEPLSKLTGPLMAAIVLPYLGQPAAEKELHKPAALLKTKTSPPHRDPLDGLDMRLTYRTVRVLIAIAAVPGASNRQVAGEAGIADQGQISKLLARLQHLGLIENSGDGQVRGGPNAWTLTPKGAEFERSIRTDSHGS